MATKSNAKYGKTFKSPRGNSLGSTPNQGGPGNPRDYENARRDFKTGAMFKKGKK